MNIIDVVLFIACLWLLIVFITSMKMYYKFKMDCKLEAAHIELEHEMYKLKKDGYRYLIYEGYLKAAYNLNNIGKTKNVNNLMDLFDDLGFEVEIGNAESVDSILNALDLSSDIEDGSLVSFSSGGKIKRGYIKKRMLEKSVLYRGGRTHESSIWYERLDGIGKIKFGNDDSYRGKQYETVFMCWPVDYGRDKIKISKMRGDD